MQALHFGSSRQNSPPGRGWVQTSICRRQSSSLFGKSTACNLSSFRAALAGLYPPANSLRWSGLFLSLAEAQRAKGKACRLQSFCIHIISFSVWGGDRDNALSLANLSSLLPWQLERRNRKSTNESIAARSPFAERSRGRALSCPTYIQETMMNALHDNKAVRYARANHFFNDKAHEGAF